MNLAGDKKRRYHLATFGCQMNKNDSERLEAILRSLSFVPTEQPEEADVLLINTCSVRQSAEDRVCGFIYNWQKLRANNPRLVIAVTGCMPGRDKDGKLRQKLDGVDLFFPIEEMVKLPEWLRGLNPDWFLETPAGEEGARDYWQIDPARQNNFRSAITIQTGCNNFCTYCVVPEARGREKNRPVKEILLEIERAVAAGAKEIILLGQVVNNFRLRTIPPQRDPAHVAVADYGFLNQNNPFVFKDDFAALLWEVNNLAGDFRVHWMAADPQYFNEDQIEALKLPKQANYLHLPAQSGDNEILRKMNRKYAREDYIVLVQKIRQARPGIALGTDLIVGFCGESPAQFDNTLDLYRQCDFDIAYQAMYSERSGTVAAKAFDDDVPREEKKRRWEAVQELMETTAYRKNQNYIGKTVSVLVESCNGGVCSGNSSEMKLVQFLGNADLIGQIVKVKIFEAMTWVLKGKIL